MFRSDAGSHAYFAIRNDNDPFLCPLQYRRKHPGLSFRAEDVPNPGINGWHFTAKRKIWEDRNDE